MILASYGAIFLETGVRERELGETAGSIICFLAVVLSCFSLCKLYRLFLVLILVMQALTARLLLSGSV